MTLTCLDSKIFALKDGEITEVELERKTGANYVDINRSHIRQWHVNPEPRSGMREIPGNTEKIILYIERGMSTNHYRIRFIDVNGNPLKVAYL
jgi:hypothetical protein